MKRITIKAVALCMMLLGVQNTSAQSLDDILGAIGSATSQSQDNKGGSLISGLTSIFSGSKTATNKNIVGTWIYQEPAILLTSNNVLTSAAAKIASKKIEKNLQTHLTKYGIKPGAMSITFSENGTFTEKNRHKNRKGQMADQEQTAHHNLRHSEACVHHHANRREKPDDCHQCRQAAHPV